MYGGHFHICDHVHILHSAVHIYHHSYRLKAKLSISFISSIAFQKLSRAHNWKKKLNSPIIWWKLKQDCRKNIMGNKSQFHGLLNSGQLTWNINLPGRLESSKESASSSWSTRHEKSKLTLDITIFQAIKIIFSRKVYIIRGKGKQKQNRL